MPVRIAESHEHPGPQKTFRILNLGPDKKPARRRIDGRADPGDYSLKNAIGIRRDRCLDFLAKGN